MVTSRSRLGDLQAGITNTGMIVTRVVLGIPTSSVCQVWSAVQHVAASKSEVLKDQECGTAQIYSVSEA